MSHGIEPPRPNPPALALTFRHVFMTLCPRLALSGINASRNHFYGSRRVSWRKKQATGRPPEYLTLQLVHSP